MAVISPMPSPYRSVSSQSESTAAEHLRAQTIGEHLAAEQGPKHRGDFAGGGDDAAPGPGEGGGQVELRHVHGLGLAREQRVVRGEVPARAVTAERAFDQIRLVESERRKDVLPERVAQRHAGRLLDDEPQYEVVAAVVRPPLARREQARLLHDQLELLAVAELEAVRRVPAIWLEELHEIAGEIVEAARVVQELADGDAGDEGRSIAVELEQPFVDEPEDKWGHEDLRDASDAETVARCEGLPGLYVGDPRRCLDSLVRPHRDDHRARNTGGDDSLELILNGFHGRPRDTNPLGSVPHQERSRGPAPELARQPA